MARIIEKPFEGVLEFNRSLPLLGEAKSPRFGWKSFREGTVEESLRHLFLGFLTLVAGREKLPTHLPFMGKIQLPRSLPPLDGAVFLGKRELHESTLGESQCSFQCSFSRNIGGLRDIEVNMATMGKME